MALPLEKTISFTYSDYLKLDDENRYEIIYGELIMVPAPNMRHQSISGKLYLLFGNFVTNNSLGSIYHPPTDVILDDKNVVQPDLLFISKDNENIIKEKGVFGSPDLVAEIISKSSKYRDTYQKKELYENFKIKEYWLVDPYYKSIEVLKLNEKGKYELFSEGFADEPDNNTIKSSVLNGLEINLEEIF